MKIRQDAWTEENDLLLAETVLKHVREGSTQLNAFEEVGDHLNRTSAACGFRWNAVVRHDYEKALQLAKKQRKQRQRVLGQSQPVKKTLLYTPPTPSLEEFAEAMPITMEDIPVQSKRNPVINTIATKVSMDQVISFLQTLKHGNTSTTALQSENERLKIEKNEILHKNEELKKKISQLEQSSENIQEDYETLMKIMNRARKLVLFDEEEDRPATKFKMDRNGNLEKLAE
ncbi:RsfA family transcriptional regulator [Fredinandcohnia quinoae]|uniref:RsfA family transcriptional regulator n=1 Tax=Fredinandcohnia quinoae TaxID=2918902 RepID=A0AAW5E3P2_9BACI|nr:RsfA family transcriptional regulator [Fredinandcohnia sp. SECRCQ15]MCH1626174.1 RsfA family transcriptional regulator [Fredinandcohnia sp. SECRCQ15]